MEKKLNNWERLEAVIRWANMSTNYFARYIGLARGENLYQIKRGNNGISLDLAEHIVERFPDINKLWLLTGEGTMFLKNDRHKPIPYYKLDPEQEIGRVAELCPEEYLILPMSGASDYFAMCYAGRAMGAVLPAGSIVVLREIAPDAIIPGGEYVIVSKKIISLRIVRTADDAQRWRLAAGDRENYDDIYLNKDEIERAYKVKVKITIND